ncbi:HAD-like domain-containing protein [Dipodascopsis tothii]|uniref:HAD-like domain-containing protein n=1 Tax=Dipodascopsis tothii TaxID=44089 RepID=UPI0034CD3D58
MSLPHAVVVDIEGTVCSIAFVKSVLFPYFLEALPELLSAYFATDAATAAAADGARPYLDAFPEMARGSSDALYMHIKELVDRDLKVTELKALQGYVWTRGYATGAIRAPLYEDVYPALERWQRAGRKLYVYSSGSVPAQKLLFGHTEAGDVTGAFAGYFDTVNAGPKTEAASYGKIAAAVGIDPAALLFLSDNVREIEAAKAAGWNAIVAERPGNAPLTAADRSAHRVVTTFADVP